MKKYEKMKKKQRQHNIHPPTTSTQFLRWVQLVMLLVCLVHGQQGGDTQQVCFHNVDEDRSVVVVNHCCGELLTRLFQRGWVHTRRQYRHQWGKSFVCRLTLRIDPTNQIGRNAQHRITCILFRQYTKALKNMTPNCIAHQEPSRQAYSYIRRCDEYRNKATF